MTLILAALSTVCLANFIKPGEKIYYKIVQLGIKTGRASLTFAGPRIYRQKKLILIVFQAQALNFFDQERIFLNPSDFMPLFVERNLNIFGKKEKITEEYGQGYIRIIKGKSQQTINSAGWPDNIYAFIYRYRCQGTFQIGDTLAIHLPNKDINIRLVKQNSVDAAGKGYDAFYMESDPADYKIWFDTSAKKIPLRISGAIKMANTVMVMTKYEN